ncbi:hypothetical protein DAPPUDRAFT_110771 [Daphnia pulex]|uniref:Uncharacterized protein n=1 Tax=Daphnia pulex TaxID=6669 RepID=E9H6Y0_DAPPU|nr:hypothetical protein DAPPUDRAFT_110771 [Daphnia pulex]|eukprot:EFX72477.1 hypothetical protein DAPPUDRAFT_110771 [Daphnia pulex]
MEEEKERRRKGECSRVAVVYYLADPSPVVVVVPYLHCATVYIYMHTLHVHKSGPGHQLKLAVPSRLTCTAQLAPPPPHHFSTGRSSFSPLIFRLDDTNCWARELGGSTNNPPTYKFLKFPPSVRSGGTLTTAFGGCCGCLPSWASSGGVLVSCYWHPHRWTLRRPTAAAAAEAVAEAEEMTVVVVALVECLAGFSSGGGRIKWATAATTISTSRNKSCRWIGRRWTMRRTRLSIRTTSGCRWIRRPT